MLQRVDSWLAALPPRLTSSLFLLPLILGLLHQLLHAKPWFCDYKAVACAGNALLHHQPLYDGSPSCPFNGAANYVYTPAGAQIFAALQSLGGTAGETVVYSLFYAASLAALFYLLLARDGLGARAPFLAGLSASALRYGNLSIPLHVAILVSARCFAARPLLLLPAIVLASSLKPTFCVYFALLLFIDRGWVRRMAYAAGGLLLTGGYFLYFRLENALDFGNWLAIIRLWGLKMEHGQGFLDFTGMAGLTGMAGVGTLYAAYAALLLGCGLLLAETGRWTPTQRLLLGIAVCILLYPRLMLYDEFALPLGLGLLAEDGGPLLRRAGLGIGVACLATGGHLGGQVLYISSCALLVWCGIAQGRRHYAHTGNRLPARLVLSPAKAG